MDYQHTLIYFEKLFKSLSIENGKSYNTKLPWTPFHSALLRGDKQLLHKLFNSMTSHGFIQVLCSAEVDYKLNFGYLLNSNSTESSGDVDQEVKLKLLNDPMTNFDFTDLVKLHDKYHSSTCQFPLTLACLSGDMEIITLLLDNGASVLCKDFHGSNIIHSLVHLSKYMPINFLLEVYDKILGTINNCEERYYLVTAENDIGYNPLDIAVKELQLEFIQALLQTDGVYRFVTHSCGPYQHVLYDISRYEGACAKNPLGVHFLSHFSQITEDQLEYFARHGIINKEPFKTWISVLSEEHTLQLYIWTGWFSTFMLLYLMQIILYYYLDEHTKYYSLAGILLYYSLCTIAGELYNISMEWKEILTVIKNWSTKGFPIAFKSYYRLEQFIFAILLLTTEIMFFVGVSCEGNDTIYAALNTLTVISGCLSLILFSQLSHKMGHINILFEKMVFDASLLILIWFIPYLIYVLSFQILHTQFDLENENATMSNLTMFSSISNTAYEVYVLITGVIVPDQIHFEQSNIPSFTMFMYSGFMVFFNVMFMNLLIAFMSLKVSTINKYRDTMTNLQRLSLTLFLDKLSYGPNICNPFKHKQMATRKKYLIEIKEINLLYLKVVETE